MESLRLGCFEVHDVGLPIGGNVAGTHDMAVGDDAAVEVGVQAW